MAGEESRAMGPMQLAITDTDRKRVPTIRITLTAGAKLALTEIVSIVQSAKQYPPGTPLRVLFYVDSIEVYGAFWVFKSLAESPLVVHSYEYNHDLWVAQGAVYTAKRTGYGKTVSCLTDMAQESAKRGDWLYNAAADDAPVPDTYGDW